MAIWGLLCLLECFKVGDSMLVFVSFFSLSELMVIRKFYLSSISHLHESLSSAYCFISYLGVIKLQSCLTFLPLLPDGLSLLSKLSSS